MLFIDAESCGAAADLSLLCGARAANSSHPQLPSSQLGKKCVRRRDHNASRQPLPWPSTYSRSQSHNLPSPSEIPPPDYSPILKGRGRTHSLTSLLVERTCDETFRSQAQQPLKKSSTNSDDFINFNERSPIPIETQTLDRGIARRGEREREERRRVTLLPGEEFKVRAAQKLVEAMDNLEQAVRSSGSSGSMTLPTPGRKAPRELPRSKVKGHEEPRRGSRFGVLSHVMGGGKKRTTLVSPPTLICSTLANVQLRDISINTNPHGMTSSINKSESQSVRVCSLVSWVFFPVLL